MLERDEDVVVHGRSRPAEVDLRVAERGGAEELERLVDEVTAEVEEQTAGLLSAGLLAPAAG
jgi:hypothetical protein